MNAGKIFQIHSTFLLNDLNVLNSLNQFLFDPSLQKPSSPHPIVVDPRNGAAASFGVIVVALDFLVPPTAGENVGAGELIDIAVLVSEDEPTILMGMTWSARQRYRLRHNPAHQHLRSWGVQVVQIVQSVQVVQIVLRKLDTAERLPSKTGLGKVPIFSLRLYDCIVVEVRS